MSGIIFISGRLGLRAERGERGNTDDTLTQIELPLKTFLHTFTTMAIFRSLFTLLALIIATVSAGTNQQGLDFLAKKATEEGVVKLASGLLYKELVPGSGKTPTAKSPCACHYSGTLIDGTEFDSSYKRGAVSIRT